MSVHSAFFYLGSDQFEQLRKKGQFYIDKSLFIKDIFESPGFVQLILRPRRFGKSLNLDMLRCFLSEPKSDSGLFDGLAICSYPELMAERGEHPCVLMTLKDMGSASSWDAMLQAVSLSFYQLFQRFSPVIDSVLTPTERKKVENYIAEEASIEDLKLALYFLTELLERVHHKKIWILIDEYDAPLIQASKYDFLSTALDFFRGLFSNALKTNPYLEKAILTGVTRVSKESIVSGLNNVNVYNALSPQFATAFGFTEAETVRALENAGLSDKIEEVRSWYNGYLFAGTPIYNPWSIAQFIGRKTFQAYWSHTGDETILKNLLLNPGNDPQQMNSDLDRLLQKKEVTFNYRDNTTFRELERNRETILTLLLQSGYLTVCEILDQGSQLIKVKIPNMEILNNIKTTLFSWIYTIEPDQKNHLIKAFSTADYAAIQNSLSHFSSHLSHYDIPTSRKSRSASDLERVYHVFLLGILTVLESAYELDSNLETGEGRADLLLRPRQPQKDPGYVIEVKVADSEASMEKDIEMALQQIREKKYETRLKQASVARIHGLGICFFHKQLLLKGEPLSEPQASMVPVAQTKVEQSRGPYKIFLSYSHSDLEWKTRIYEFLLPALKGTSFEFWDDSRLDPGMKSMNELEEVMEHADLAILLVSPAFLASKFVIEFELPKILRAAQARNCLVFWIPLSHSSVKYTKILEFQAAWDPNRPLKALKEIEQDKALEQITDKLLEALKKRT